MSEQDFIDKIEKEIRTHLAHLDDDILEIMCKQLHEYPLAKQKAAKWDIHVHVCNEYKVKNPEEAVGEINHLRKKLDSIKSLKIHLIPTNTRKGLEKREEAIQDLGALLDG